jgi:hypothetical protein
MAERLSRRQLYDRVWSEPLRSLSARFGSSDVALKWTCQLARIPPRNAVIRPRRSPANDDLTSAPSTSSGH